MESEAPPPGPDPLVGRVLANKMEVEALLGEGAMGRVYRARHLSLDKTVAIKVLHKELNTDKSIVGRFKAEARGASRLTHPNAVQILDFGVDGPDGLLYIAMEFLEGEDMSKILAREHRFSPSRSANLMVQILGALADAHDQDVIHRDMKPGNIVVTPRRGDDGGIVEVVKVCDFGLAKLLDRDAEQSSTGPLTKAGQVFGTPAFMSPEQARGEVLDVRTDLYSCGCILYRMLSGDMPFRAESVVGVLMKQISEEPTPLGQLAPDAPPGLIEVVKRAMAKNRDERYSSAREMRQDLVSLFGADLSQPYIPSVRGASAVAALSSPDLIIEATAPSIGRISDQGSASQASMTGEPVATGRRAWLVMLPGLLALVLLGGLAVFVVQKLDARSGAVANQAPVPRPPSQAVAEKSSDPTPPPPLEVPPAAPEPKADPALAPKPEKEPSRTPRPSKVKAPRPAAPEPGPAPTAPPPSEKPAAEKPAAESPPVDPAKPPVADRVEDRARALERELVERAVTESKPRPAPPLVPPRPAPATRVSVKMDDLKVGGGMSKGRVQQALIRYVPEAQSCFSARASSFESGTKGEVRINATIELSGRLRGIKAEGGPAIVQRCAKEAFQGAVLPKPDTGGAKLEFLLRYSAG